MEMARLDSLLRRYRGGYWVAGFPKCDDYGRPVGHHCGSHTLRALEERGLIMRTNRDIHEYKDARTLTPKGEDLAVELLAAERAKEG